MAKAKDSVHGDIHESTESSQSTPRATMGSTTPFGLSEWREILARAIDSIEARKAEFTRWTAGGLTAIATMVGLILSRLPDTDLGAAPGVTLLLLACMAYIASRGIWEALKSPIANAVHVLVDEDYRPPTTADIVTATAAIKGASRGWVLRTVISWNLLVTAALLWLLLMIPPLSMFMNIAWVITIRVAIFLGLLWLVLRFREMGSEALKIFVGPSPVPDAESDTKIDTFAKKSLSLGFSHGGIPPLALVGLQEYLLTPALAAVSSISFQMALVLLLMGSAMTVGFWVAEVTWPLTRAYSAGIQRLTNVHSDLLFGVFHTPADLVEALQARGIVDERKSPRHG